MLPYYMYLGMTAEDFWHGDPMNAMMYRKMHLMKQDEENARAWWQGYYNYVAVATALQNGFRDKNKKAEPYPKEPFRIREKTELEKDKEIIAERKRVVSFLDALKRDFDLEQEKLREQNG